ASRVRVTGQKLADLAGVVQRLPQTLVNVPGVDKTRASTDEALLAAVAAAERTLGETGRVLLRPSGTEPLVRVMVEAATQQQAAAVAGELAGGVRGRLALCARPVGRRVGRPARACARASTRACATTCARSWTPTP